MLLRTAAGRRARAGLGLGIGRVLELRRQARGCGQGDESNSDDELAHAKLLSGVRSAIRRSAGPVVAALRFDFGERD